MQFNPLVLDASGELWLRWVVMAQKQHTRSEQGRQTVERERYGLAEHAVNGLATFSRTLGLGVTRLDRDSLITTARRRTNLEDTGDDAPSKDWTASSPSPLAATPRSVRPCCGVYC